MKKFIALRGLFVLVLRGAFRSPRATNDMFYGLSLCRLTPAQPAGNISVQPYTIAIDPGHGGFDTGAQYIVDEIEVIDQTARRLYRLLEADENFMPVYTRTKEEDPESRERCRTAKNAGAALLISLHANCDSSRKSHGFECFPLPPGRRLHRDSLRFAQLITREMAAAGHYLRGSEVKDGIKYAYYQGKRKIIVESTDTKARSGRSFGILENSACPAVLVEQCFITNHNDVNNWGTPEGCRRAAECYYRAIKAYFGV